MRCVRLIHWNAAEAEDWAAGFMAVGYDVVNEVAEQKFVSLSRTCFP